MVWKINERQKQRELKRFGLKIKMINGKLDKGQMLDYIDKQCVTYIINKSWCGLTHHAVSYRLKNNPGVEKVVICYKGEDFLFKACIKIAEHLFFQKHGRGTIEIKLSDAQKTTPTEVSE